MNKKSIMILVCIFSVLSLLTASCGEKQEPDAAVIDQTAAVSQPTDSPTEQASVGGVISGVVGLQAPPTPPMTIYAVDPLSGVWYSTETPQAEGEAPYQIEVAPGSYQVFAFTENGSYSGYSLDGWELSLVAVMAGQTATGINLYPPGQSDCGSLFGVPDSPDGRFSGVSNLCELQDAFTPLNESECSSIARSFSAEYNLAAETSQAPYTDPISSLTGTSCLISMQGSAVNFENLAAVRTTVTRTLNLFSFLEDAALGQADGPTGFMMGFRQGNKTCQVLAEWEPAADANCPDDQPISECDLTPEQMLYTLTLNCVEEPLETATLPKTEPERIQFAAGATAARIEKTLGAGELHPYVLGIMAGQQLSVVLTPADGAVLEIWGLDGTTLAALDASLSSWNGTVPSSQDYYIDVISTGSSTLSYTLDVTIPAISGTSGQVFPETQPFETDIMQSLAWSGVPLILPPAFTGETGLPAISPFIISIDPQEFEVSLDYGSECQGGGACHYGVITAHPSGGINPVGSANYPFDAAQAQQVSLAQGITGYFVNYTCGANCGDALIFWVYQDYEYMFGLKAGAQENLIALVNAAIENSIPD